MSTPVTTSLRRARRRIRVSAPGILASLAVLLATSTAAATGPTDAASTGPAGEAPAEEAPAEVGEGDRAAFGVQPANAAGGIDARAFFQYGLPAQATVFDYVGIVNYGPEDLTLEVYGTDAVSSDTGDFSLLAGDVAPSDAGTWISIGDAVTEVTVPPADADGPGTVVLPVTIAVPENASPGDHTAGVLAVLSLLGENTEGQNVQLEQRVGARLYIRVDGELAPGLTISETSGVYRAGSMPWRPGRVDLSYRVTNSGNVRMGVSPSVTVAGAFGLFKERADEPPLPELLPGGSYVVEQTVDDVWPLVALLTRIRLDPVAAPGAQPPELAPVTTTILVLALPWLLLLIILVVVLALVLRLLVRRRRRRRREGPEQRPEEPEPPSAPPAAPVGAVQT